jgi:phosphohistidine phosphatase
MEIYLLRHGIAENHAPTGKDADRRLTDEGREKLHRVLERARKAGVSPSLILSSPLKRALETAEIAAQELGYEAEILRSPALTPDSSPPSVWAEIRTHKNTAWSRIYWDRRGPSSSSKKARWRGSTSHHWASNRAACCSGC